MEHFKSLSSYLEYLQLPPSEHPMLSVFSTQAEEFLPCPRESSPPITNDCFSISLKKIVKGALNYGRTQYDFSHGALIFIAPRQVLQWDASVVYDQRGFSITFHEDFLKGTALAQEIKKYGFFSYSANEALHLSPREEQQMEDIVNSIELEYRNNQDVFSKDIIISQLSTLLKYANRFYERQFIHRKEFSQDLLSQFNAQLNHYYEENNSVEKGLPRIDEIATKIGVSKRYLSDTLKKETGKTSSDHLQLFLIDQAKNKLLNPNKTIAEVAFDLGFEYPPYFSRLFKKKEGISPSMYREKYKMN